MELKPGVDPAGLRPELLIALNVADSVCRRLTQRGIRVTSLNDSRHSRGSLHFSGAAADIHTKSLPVPAKVLASAIIEALGWNKAYDVLVEDNGGANEHIHIEWQPKEA